MPELVGWLALWAITTAAGVLVFRGFVWCVDRSIRAGYSVTSHLRWRSRGAQR